MAEAELGQQVGHPKGRGGHWVWLPPNFTRRSGEVMFNVPPWASSPRLMHFLSWLCSLSLLTCVFSLEVAPQLVPEHLWSITSSCHWCRWVQAKCMEGAWAGQRVVTSFPRLTPGLAEELLCHCRRWRREHSAANKSFLTTGKCHGLCDGAELMGGTAPWAEPPLPVLLGKDCACGGMMLGDGVSGGRFGPLGGCLHFCMQGASYTQFVVLFSSCVAVFIPFPQLLDVRPEPSTAASSAGAKFRPASWWTCSSVCWGACVFTSRWRKSQGFFEHQWEAGQLETIACYPQSRFDAASEGSPLYEPLFSSRMVSAGHWESHFASGRPFPGKSRGSGGSQPSIPLPWDELSPLCCTQSLWGLHLLGLVLASTSTTSWAHFPN